MAIRNFLTVAALASVAMLSSRECEGPHTPLRTRAGSSCPLPSPRSLAPPPTRAASHSVGLAYAADVATGDAAGSTLDSK